LNDKAIIFDQGPLGPNTAFCDPLDLIVAWTAEEVGPAFAAIQTAHEDGKWIAGYCAYELGLLLEPKLAHLLPASMDTPLMCFGVFQSPSATSPVSTSDATLDALDTQWTQAKYTEKFDRLHELICAGDTYQVNLTFPIKTHTKSDPLNLYQALVARQPVDHGAFVNLGVGPVILSRSPELFFRVDTTGRIETRPMKGTMPRSADPQEDADAVAFLKSDPKNRAENLMIVDLMRNDLSIIAKPRSVHVPQLFQVETYNTVHQMVSSVAAELVDDASIEDIFRALFPGGSITGAPKVRAMEIIADLEETPRGAYCGSVGWIAPNREMSFNIAIRTLTLLDGGKARLNVGGGIVYDSTAPSEYTEALWKSRFAHL
jgi:para-aminobenzoate synthetase component 1